VAQQTWFQGQSAQSATSAQHRSSTSKMPKCQLENVLEPSPARSARLSIDWSNREEFLSEAAANDAVACFGGLTVCS
jgi:hypothetical protein